MTQLIDTVIRFLGDEEWRFTKREGSTVLELLFQGDNGQWACFAETREEEAQVLFYSIFPLNAPPARRLAMAELLTRINYGLYMGNFEMDFEDGEIRFKTSIDVEGDRLSLALMRPLVYANILTMDRYLPGIGKCIRGELGPVDAIAEIEGL